MIFGQSRLVKPETSFQFLFGFPARSKRQIHRTSFKLVTHWKIHWKTHLISNGASLRPWNSMEIFL